MSGGRRPSCPSRPRSPDDAPEVTRAEEELTDARDLLERVAVPLLGGVQREAEHADRVPRSCPPGASRGTAPPSRGIGGSGEDHRLCERVAALRRGRLERRLAVGDAVRVAGEQPADLVIGQAGDARGAQRDQERRGLLPVGGSRRRRAPARARPGSRSRAGRSGSRPRCSKNTPALPAKCSISAARSAFPALLRDESVDRARLERLHLRRARVDSTSLTLPDLPAAWFRDVDGDVAVGRGRRCP
jgi:hypothetical protein